MINLCLKYKRGLSTVVTTLIIITLVLLAVVIVWSTIKGMIQGSVDQMSLGKITIDLKIKEVSVSGNNVNVTVKRNPGAGDMKSLRFIFSNDTDSETIEVDANTEELEQKKFNLTLTSMSGADVKKVSIAPVLLIGDSQKEQVIEAVSTYTVSSSGGPSCADNDGDTYTNSSCGGTDCDDSNASINPNAAEVCSDGVDNNCNGLIDCLEGGSCVCAGNTFCNTAGVCQQNDTLFLMNTFKDSLVSWWRFNGDADDKISGNNGAENGGVYMNLSGGKFNGAYEFDGVDDFVNVSNDASLDFDYGKPFSLCTWFKADSLTNSRLIKKEDSNNDGYRLQFNNGEVRFTVREDNDFLYRVETSIPSPSTDVWRFVCGTFNGSNSIDAFKIYMDGAEDIDTATGNGPGVSFSRPSATLTIGNLFNGTIDEVMLFNKSLSASEISTIYGLDLT